MAFLPLVADVPSVMLVILAKSRSLKAHVSPIHARETASASSPASTSTADIVSASPVTSAITALLVGKFFSYLLNSWQLTVAVIYSSAVPIIACRPSEIVISVLKGFYEEFDMNIGNSYIYVSSSSDGNVANQCRGTHLFHVLYCSSTALKTFIY